LDGVWAALFWTAFDFILFLLIFIEKAVVG